MSWSDLSACRRPGARLVGVAAVVLVGCAEPAPTGDGGFSVGGGALSTADAVADAKPGQTVNYALQASASVDPLLCFDGACPKDFTCKIVVASWGTSYKICSPPAGKTCPNDSFCKDGNKCTVESCDPSVGCVYELVAGCPQPTSTADASTPPATEPPPSTSLADATGTPEANPQPASQPAEAGGAFRTQTPGGWGGTCSGGNAGCYRDWWFPLCLPDGLTVGACARTLFLANSAVVEDLLPTDGTPGVLPTGGVLVGHTVAASLSLAFDACNPDFSSSDVALADLVACPGQPCAGMSAAAILAAANLALGGCTTAPLSPEAVNTCLTKLNESWVGGQQANGYLCLP